MLNMLKKSPVVLSVMAAVLLTGTGCASSTQRTTGSTERTAGQTLDDATITTRVKAALIQNPATKARDIHVEVYQGQVQLAGFVDSSQEKAAAERTARSVEGVKRVRNSLEVHAADRSAGVFLDDSMITAKVKAALVKDTRTKAFQIEVNTNQGVVQLAGFVDNMSAKAAAGEVAETISGVKTVRNDLEVKS